MFSKDEYLELNKRVYAFPFKSCLLRYTVKFPLFGVGFNEFWHMHFLKAGLLRYH